MNLSRRRLSQAVAALVGLPICAVHEPSLAKNASKKKRHKKKSRSNYHVTNNTLPDGPVDGYILEDEESGEQQFLGHNGDIGSENFGQQRWYQNRIPLKDWTTEGIGIKIAEAADDWNFALGGGITLFYERMSSTTDCEGVDFVHGEITVCNQNSKYIEGIKGCEGMTGCTIVRGRYLANGYWTISAAKVVIAGLRCDISDGAFSHWGHCLEGHELGHALGFNHIENWDDQISVMGVRRRNPGSRDAQEAYKEYGGNGGYIVPGPTPECCATFLHARDNNVHVKPLKNIKKKKGKLHPNRGKRSYKRTPGGIWPPPVFLSGLE